MKHKWLSDEYLSSLCMELSLLFHAGINVADGAHLLLEDQTDEDSRGLLQQIAEGLDQNQPLSLAMEQTARFPDYMINMIGVGEQSGRSEESLRALSRYYESRDRLRRRIRGALLYPAVLLILMLVVIVVLLAKVLPVFNDVYVSLGGALTGVAGGLLMLGRVLNDLMPVLCVLLAAAVLWLALFAGSDTLREKWLSAWHSRRGDRGVARAVSTARFAQALAMGMQSGLPAVESIRMAEHLGADTDSAKLRIHDCLSRLEQGSAFAEALRESGVLPAAECRMLALGIRSGTGDAVIADIARRLEEQSEQEIERRVERVEPTIVIGMSVLVGAILLTVMLPLINIMAAIG